MGIFLLLLSHGLNVHAYDQALCKACFSDNYELVRILLDLGMKPDEETVSAIKSVSYGH